MLPDALEKALTTLDRAKLIYVIPDFQNPSGRTWSVERRRKLATLAARHRIAVIEDNPYGELRFEGEELPSVQSFDAGNLVLTTGTFSKIFCPGHRVAWIAGDKDIIRKYVLAKQGTDLQSNTMAQMVIAKFLELYDIDAHIQSIRELYRSRRKAMVAAMEREFPDTVSFTRPQGGLFAWVTLPEKISARDLLVHCLEKNVAFVPGGAFFPNTNRENTMRLNFSNMPEERINDGIARIAAVLKHMM